MVPAFEARIRDIFTTLVIFAKIAEFRSLNDEKGMPILSNVRPLKGKQEKSVFHVSPSGSTYASLLPIPRDLLSSEIEEDSDAD